jgi:hypothetical protein
MSEAQNTQVVQGAYAAFGRGDITTLLSLMGNAQLAEIAEKIGIFRLQTDWGFCGLCGLCALCPKQRA